MSPRSVAKRNRAFSRAKVPFYFASKTSTMKIRSLLIRLTWNSGKIRNGSLRHTGVIHVRARQDLPFLRAEFSLRTRGGWPGGATATRSRTQPRRDSRIHLRIVWPLRMHLLCRRALIISSKSPLSVLRVQSAHSGSDGASPSPSSPWSRARAENLPMNGVH